MNEIMKMINPTKKAVVDVKEEVEMLLAISYIVSNMKNGLPLSLLESTISKAIREFKASVEKKVIPKAI